MPDRKKTDPTDSLPAPSYSVEDRANYLYIRCQGELTSHTVVEILDTNYANPRLRMLNDLWDLREAHSTVMDYGRIRNVVAHIAKRGYRMHKRSALVVRDPVHLGLSKIYQALTEMEQGNDLSVRVFQDLESATNWLDKPDPD